MHEWPTIKPVYGREKLLEKRKLFYLGRRCKTKNIGIR